MARVAVRVSDSSNSAPSEVEVGGFRSLNYCVVALSRNYKWLADAIRALWLFRVTPPRRQPSTSNRSTRSFSRRLSRPNASPANLLTTPTPSAARYKTQLTTRDSTIGSLRSDLPVAVS